MSATLEDRIRAYATTLDAATPRPSGPSAPADRELVELVEPVPAVAPRRDRRLVAVAAIAVVAILTGAVAALTLGGGHDSDRVSTVTSAPHPTSTSTSIAPTTTAPTTSAPTTTAKVPTAGDTLDPFFRGAAELDKRLRTAAGSINAGLGPTGITVTPAARAAVEAANPGPLTTSIPAGLPASLERAVLVVWSELDSRYMAMACVGSGTLTNAELDQFGCLKGGSEAARRFASDLASAKSLASSLPVPAPVAASSRTAGELAVQINVIEEGNGGCASVGGFIVDQLPPIVWYPHTIGTGTSATMGTVGRTPFYASYSPTTGWFAREQVC